MENQKTVKENAVALARSISVIIEGNTYQVNFPNMGGIIDIETRKLSFSFNKYPDLVKAQLISADLALDLIEMSAYLSVLIPDLIKDLRVSSLFELDIFNAKKLVKINKSQILPWYHSWLKKLNEVDEENS